MTEIFRASEKDWEAIMRRATPEGVGVCELRDRVAALEAARQAEVELLHAARAEQQQEAGVKDSLTAQPEPSDSDVPGSLHDVALAHVETLGRSFHILPQILHTLRRAIREPMAAPAGAGRVATDEELIAVWDRCPGTYVERRRAVYNLGRQHGAIGETARSPRPTRRAASAGGLVDKIMEAAELTAIEAKWALDAVAEWLKERQPSHETEPDSIDFAAYLLSMEATR